MDISQLTGILTYVFYIGLALIALWGAFCVVMVWMRVAEKRFRNEEEQSDFLSRIEDPLARGDFLVASEQCEGDPRAVSQLVHLAIANREIGYSKVRQMVLDRFQRDILSDLEYRLSWVYTIIKTAPMVGLLGTVVGMMGAFATLSLEENVDATSMAGDISLALTTTACGLAIAIPLVFCTASINVRIRKMEDLVAVGLTRFLAAFRLSLGHSSKEER